MRAAGRKTAFVAGIGVVAVLGLGAAYWQELAIQYHMRRFSRDEAYLRASLEDPEDSIRGRALQRFIDDPASSEALIRVFILEVSARDVNVAVRLRADHYDEALICLCGWKQIDFYGWWEEPFWATKAGGFGESLECSEKVHSRLEAIQRVLASRKARSAAVREYPDAEFSFVPIDQIPSESLLAHPDVEGCAHVCTVRWPKRIAAKRAQERSMAIPRSLAIPRLEAESPTPAAEASAEE